MPEAIADRFPEPRNGRGGCRDVAQPLRFIGWWGDEYQLTPLRGSSACTPSRLPRVDVGTFWDPVARLLSELTAAGFVPAATARSLVRVSGAAEFLGLLR